MIINGAFKVVTSKIIEDPETSIDNVKSLPELFPFWSLEQIIHRLYGHTMMTENDAYQTYNILVESGYIKYAQLFLQEIYRDPNITLTGNGSTERISEDKLHLHVMKLGGKFGDILKMTAEHLKDGILTIPELEEEIEFYRNVENNLKSILQMLLEKKAEKVEA